MWKKCQHHLGNTRTGSQIEEKASASLTHFHLHPTFPSSNSLFLFISMLCLRSYCTHSPRGTRRSKKTQGLHQIHLCIPNAGPRVGTQSVIGEEQRVTGGCIQRALQGRGRGAWGGAGIEDKGRDPGILGGGQDPPTPDDGLEDGTRDDPIR